MTRNKIQATTFRFILLTAILTSALFISGCTGGRQPQPMVIYTGTQGVEIAFLDNNPPMEVYENSQAIVMAEIWNMGAFTPKSGNNTPIYISLNIDNIYFDVTGGVGSDYEYANLPEGNMMSLYLNGKSQEWPVGERTIQPIANLHVKEIPGTRESPTTKIELSACYEYKTTFTEQICVDSDMYNLEKSPICRNMRTYTYAGQGAPLIISKMEVDMVPVGTTPDMVPTSIPVVDAQGQIQEIGDGETVGKSIIVAPSFRIYFANADNGVVLNTKYFDDGYGERDNPCVSGSTNEGRAAKITAYLGNNLLNCTDEEMRMYANEGSVRCFLPIDRIPSDFTLNRNYELPLTIQAEYFYRTTAVKDVKIVRVI